MPVVQVPPAVGTSGQFIDAIIITSSTLRQVNVIGDSVTSGIFAPVTSSGGLRVSMSSGTVTLSSAIAISSGLVTMSSVQTVTATAGTNPWSSAPGFNVPIVSVSSGLVQLTSAIALSSGTVTLSTIHTVVVATSAGIFGSTAARSVGNFVASSSGNSTLVLADGAALYGYAVFNTTGTIRYIHLYNTSSAPGIGTTANLFMTVPIPGSTAGGGGANLVSPTPLNYSTRGLGFTVTDGPGSTSTAISQAAGDSIVEIFYSA